MKCILSKRKSVQNVLLARIFFVCFARWFVWNAKSADNSFEDLAMSKKRLGERNEDFRIPSENETATSVLNDDQWPLLLKYKAKPL